MPIKPSQLDKIFKALADRNRRFIVQRLCRGSAQVSELASLLPMALPSALQHLDVLEASGIVRSEKVGRIRTCWIDADALTAAVDWIESRKRSLHRHAREDWR
ncbi:MAG: metalloregulator ArsR/SmtB family transcription factor [Vicinamibacterales bacterium]|nr:metalloregulator ArsR/SmtB family transcription factor [Vicinamibacterales bacterium]